MVTTLFRQGDVLIRPVSNVQMNQYGVVKKEPVNGRLVVAEGEVTGHTHGFDLEEGGPEVSMFTQSEWGRGRSTERTFLRVTGGVAVLNHDEHDEIELPEGEYEIVFQQEYEPRLGTQRVYD